MNKTISTKLFLDVDGLKALIAKISMLREEYLGEVDGLKSHIDKLLKIDTDLGGRIGIEEGKEIVVSIVEAIEGLKTELEDFKNDVGESVKEILDELEESIKEVTENLKDLEESIKEAEESIKDIETDLADVVVELSETKDKVKDIEEGLANTNDKITTNTNEIEALKETAFTKVTSEYNRESHEVKVVFDAPDKEGVGEFTIDTSDFILDGILEDVKVVTVKNGEAYGSDGSKIDDVVVPEGKGDNKYLVFSFNVTDLSTVQPATGTRMSPEDYKNTLKDIWVDLDDLYEGYAFTAKSEDEEYVLFTTETTEDGTEKINNVYYKVELTTKAKEAFELVEGTDEYKGIKDLNTALTESKDDLDTIKDEVKDLNEWSENGTIDPKNIELYFDFHVLGESENNGENALD